MENKFINLRISVLQGTLMILKWAVEDFGNEPIEPKIQNEWEII